MRLNGHNLLAILVAAIAIYLIEFVIFAVVIPADLYMAYTGVTEAQVADNGWRMPIGFVMPLFAAIGLSLVIKWRNAPGLMGGLTTAVWMAVLFAFGTSLYSYVYGPHMTAYLPVNLGHFLLCYGVAGAILGAWK